MRTFVGTPHQTLDSKDLVIQARNGKNAEKPPEVPKIGIPTSTMWSFHQPWTWEFLIFGVTFFAKPGNETLFDALSRPSLTTHARRLESFAALYSGSLEMGTLPLGGSSNNPSAPPTPAVSAFVASPSWLLRQRICSHLRAQQGINLIGEAEDCPQMISLVNSARPDILFVDTRICRNHGANGLVCASHLTAGTRVIVICRELDVDLVVEALKEGVRGILLESSPASDFWKAAATVTGGDVWMPRTLLASAFKMALQQPPHATGTTEWPDDNLTQREKEIASLICQGKCDKEMARQLNISEKTIKTHLQHIYKKLGVHGRIQLALNHRNAPN